MNNNKKKVKKLRKKLKVKLKVSKAKLSNQNYFDFKFILGFEK